MNTPSERNNKVRLIRALEIARVLGKNPKPQSHKEYDVLWIGIAPADTTLKQKITKRLAARLREGMIIEAIRLHKAGLSFKRMRELGLEYRSLARFLNAEISKAELSKELESDIWRYARKQLGYWKRNEEITWYKPTDTAKIARAITRWLKE
jgi:tRNA dimethylallyltransferase